MELVPLYVEILADLGVVLGQDTTILDFGCGEGGLVKEGRAAGFQMFGCDFDAQGPNLSSISKQSYRLPYPDRSFDVVVSNQVFEHVMDYDSALAELSRILKPGGSFLHMFPARARFIEPHVFVPGATVLRNRPWLLLWALLGVRNQFQAGKSAIERMRLNYRYLLEHTNYMGKGALVRHFRRHFADVRFVESLCLRHRHPKLVRVPFMPRVYSALQMRVVFGRSPIAAKPGAAVERAPAATNGPHKHGRVDSPGFAGTSNSLESTRHGGLRNAARLSRWPET
jgi:SAM-dependent methyltransferase